MTVPDGYTYDSEVDNCVELFDLPQVEVISFEGDEDGSINKSWGKYNKRLFELEELLKEEGLTVGDEFYYKNHRKPRGGYSVDFFDYLYELVNKEFSRQYESAERYRRDKFIETEVRPMIGKPYVWGKMGPEFFDCSGLMCAIFEKPTKQNAQMLYDTSNLFYDLDKAKVGDILYFDHEIGRPEDDKDGRAIDHVGVISKNKG